MPEHALLRQIRKALSQGEQCDTLSTRSAGTLTDMNENAKNSLGISEIRILAGTEQSEEYKSLAFSSLVRLVTLVVKHYSCTDQQ